MLGKCWVKTACFAISGQSYPTSGVEYFPGRCWVNVGWMLGKNGSIWIFGHFWLRLWRRRRLNAKFAKTAKGARQTKGTVASDQGGFSNCICLVLGLVSV